MRCRCLVPDVSGFFGGGQGCFDISRGGARKFTNDLRWAGRIARFIILTTFRSNPFPRNVVLMPLNLKTLLKDSSQLFFAGWSRVYRYISALHRFINDSRNVIGTKAVLP